jgi:hypothetical protein
MASNAQSEIARFVDCVFDAADVVEIRRLPNAQSTWHTAQELAAQAKVLTADNDTGQNIYVGANPRRDTGGTRTADVPFARCLFADFDGITAEDVRQRIDSAGLPTPTMLIDSGHGGHAYWRLPEPMTDLAAWTTAQKRLIAALQSDKSIHDPPRIMRVPGFWNVKQEPRVPCRIIDADSQRRYAIDTLLAVLPAVELLESKPTMPVATVSSELGDVARAAAYIDKIPGASEGGRNQATYQVAAILQNDYALPPAAAEGLLRQWNQRNAPPLDDAELADVLQNGHKYSTGTPGSKLRISSDNAPSDDECAAFDPADPGPLPSGLLTVPGFIGDVMQHNLAGAFRSQNVLALAAALPLLGTLTGRKIADKSGTRTNLYCVGVCPTSKGKERAREVNKEILYASGLEPMIGPESFASAPGIVSAVERQSSILFQLDEFGRYLKTMGDARGAPHLYNILTVLMRLFTSSASVFKTDAYADPDRNRTIYQPHASIYATTTPDALYDALTTSNIGDGFLSRVLVFEGVDDPVEFDIEKPNLPPALIEQAKWWGDFRPGGNLSSVTPQPLIVSSSAEAKGVVADLRAFARQEEKDLGEPLGLLWPRAVEKAHKLALLWACSANAQSPVVDANAARWACEVVSHQTRRLVFLASRHLAENRQEADTKRMFRIIEGAKEAGLDSHQLARKTQWVKRRERDELVDTLVDAGQVVRRNIPTKTKPRTVVFARQHAPEFLAV